MKEKNEPILKKLEMSYIPPTSVDKESNEDVNQDDRVINEENNVAKSIKKSYVTLEKIKSVVSKLILIRMFIPLEFLLHIICNYLDFFIRLKYGLVKF